MASSRQQQQRAIKRIISSTSFPINTNTTTTSNSNNNNNINTNACLHSTPLSEEPRATTHNPARQDNRLEPTDELVTTLMKEDLEANLDGLKDSDLETLSSLERDLPVELSFLLRQHAVCIARVNCLERQIRELKEAKQATSTSYPIPNSSSTSTLNPSTQHSNHHHHHHHHHNNNRLANTNLPTTTNITTTTNPARIKNGNFIPSDDSGGEYSRATISDDDELSSLLDQIAKSIKPEPQTSNIPINVQSHRANYNVITNNQPQQYAFISPNQLHHHAVPVFVMGSPIAMAHPSSINSSVLPGVHFQPEPRYNQYYEDLYVQNNNNNASPSTHKQHNGIRSQQFDSSISTIEQLVSQKEKQQIDLQLRSADKWLKMRSSGLCNLNENYSNINSRGAVKFGIAAAGEVNGSTNGRNHPASSVSATMVTDNSNTVIEENRSR